MPSYTVRLAGPGVREGTQLPGVLLRDLLDVLDLNARGAVRLRLEGRSAAAGQTPRWLLRAARFDVLGLADDFPGLVLAAPLLRESLPEKFAQPTLFADPIAEHSAISLLSEGLEAALGGRPDAESYDDALLKSFERFEDVLDDGVERVEIRNGRPDSPRVIITSEGIRHIEVLQQSIPQPRRGRVAGRLDAIRYSDRAFTLVLAGNRPVRGVLAAGDAEVLAPLFGKIVVVSGLAHFRPSGALARMDAERIEVGAERDMELWSQVPVPLDVPLDIARLRRMQTPRTGIGALVGQWPGDESDEEFFRLVDELS